MSAECWRLDTFEPVVLEKTLESPWTARRSNWSILKEINPEYSLERLMLKLKLQYFGHLMWGADSLEKTLMLEKIEGGRRGQQRMRWLDNITNSMDMSLSELGSWWWTGMPGMLWFVGSWRVGHGWATELNWTELIGLDAMILVFWMLGFKPAFSLFSFISIKRFFSSSSLSAIRVVSSTNLRLLMFLPPTLIPACNSSSPAFLLMCSAYKLNKQHDNIQTWWTLLPILNSPLFQVWF